MIVPQVTAWSYSRYSDYERCPLYFKLKYLTKEIQDTGSVAMNRGSEIHTLAENYTNGKIKKLPPELANFKDEFAQLRKLDPLVEQLWGFRNDWSWSGRQGWFGDDIWFRAKADVATIYDDDTADLVDHKTGKKYGTNMDQVELFGAAGFMRYPNLKMVTVRLWYLDLKTDNEETFDITAADAVKIRKDWDKKVRPMFNDRKFAPKPNDKCRFCPASKGNGGTCKF